MSQRSLAALTIISLVGLVACGGGGGSSPTSSSPVAAAPTPAPEPIYSSKAVHADLVAGDWHELVVTDWTTQNVNGVGATISAFHVWLRGADGKESGRVAYTPGFRIDANGAVGDKTSFGSFQAARPLTTCFIIAGRSDAGVPEGVL